MGVETFTHCSPSHSQELLDKLNALRSEDLFCDVSIRVQGQLFSAHKVVLACCSDFLRAKLSGKPAEEDAVIVGEDNRHVLDLQHATVAGFAPLLEYAYTSTLSISTENIIDVLSMASYLQMFAVANTCTELMKSSILWSSGSSGAGGPGSTQPPGLHRPQEPPEGHASCALAPEDALSPPPVSPECSVPERPIPVCRESKRKRKGFASPQTEFSTSPQVPNPSPSSSSFPETSAQALEPSLVFSWTYPFGVDRQVTPEKSKLPEGLLEPSGAPGQGSSGRALVEHLACEGPRGLGEAGVEQEEEDDVQMKLQRLSADEEHEEASQPVSSLSDQQTGPGSGDPLISPQSSSSDRPQHYPFAVKCPVCPAWIANISRHLRAVHDMGNMEQRTLLINYARRRVRLSSLDCPLCGIMVKYPEKHLERGHKDLTESARSKVVRSLGRSVTVGKLQILWNSNPSIPMVHDFSQDEAPPDARQTDRRETSPLRCRRRV